MDVIVRHLTFDSRGTPHGSEQDILGLDGERAAVHHIVIEHCTGRASGDGVFDIWGRVHDVTIAWNLICDTETALHLSTGDRNLARERIVFHHNVFARNNERQIRIRHANHNIEFLNNLVYGWGGMDWGGSGLQIAYDAGEVNPSLAVVGNIFRHVPARTNKPTEAVIWERGPDEGRVWFRDNRLPVDEHDANSNSAEWPLRSGIALTPMDRLATDLREHVGPCHRSAADQRLLDEIARSQSADK